MSSLRAIGVAAGGVGLAGVMLFGATVVGVASQLAGADVTAPAPAPAAAPSAIPIAVAWAEAQIGTPYVWGGETPGVGFDCSGLVQAAYRVAGIGLPRVAQDQYDAGPLLAPSAGLQPGDLVFFGGGLTDVSHVGIYVGTSGGQAFMVDAPHTGAVVRVEAFPASTGAAWGAGDVYVGATRPGG